MGIKTTLMPMLPANIFSFLSFLLAVFPFDARAAEFMPVPPCPEFKSLAPPKIQKEKQRGAAPIPLYEDAVWHYIDRGRMGAIYRVVPKTGEPFVVKLYYNRARLLNDARALEIFREAFANTGADSPFGIVGWEEVAEDAVKMTNLRGAPLLKYVQQSGVPEAEVRKSFLDRLIRAKALVDAWSKTQLESGKIKKYKCKLDENSLRLVGEVEYADGTPPTQFLLKLDNVLLAEDKSVIIVDPD